MVSHRIAFHCIVLYHTVCRRVLVITKTSGKLGRKQQNTGTWDRLEGQGKQKCKAKMQSTTILDICEASLTAVVLALLRHFLLYVLARILFLQTTMPTAIVVLIRTHNTLKLLKHLSYWDIIVSPLPMSIFEKCVKIRRNYAASKQHWASFSADCSFPHVLVAANWTNTLLSSFV